MCGYFAVYSLERLTVRGRGDVASHLPRLRSFMPRSARFMVVREDPMPEGMSLLFSILHPISLMNTHH